MYITAVWSFHWSGCCCFCCLYCFKANDVGD